MRIPGTTFGLIALATLTLAGCTENHGPSPEQPAVQREPVPTSAAAPKTNPIRTTVHRTTFNGTWPLVPDEVELSCYPLPSFPGLQKATFTYGGREYGLNGIAQSHGFQPGHALLLDNEAIPGSKVAASDLIRAALKLCEQPNSN